MCIYWRKKVEKTEEQKSLTKECKKIIPTGKCSPGNKNKNNNKKILPVGKIEFTIQMLFKINTHNCYDIYTVTTTNIF